MKRIFITLIIILWYNIAFTTTNPIRFQHITSGDGLSQGHILDMIQDSEGYIWIGTYHGLNRYNGYTIDAFYADPENARSLFIDVAFSLFEDTDGNIWVGTWGIDIFDKKTESFTHIPAEAGENSISAGEISAITQDANKNIWLATQGGGVNKIDYKTRKITWFKQNEGKKGGLQSDYINDIIIDKDQQLWIATEGGGLSKMNLVDETITTYQYSNSPNSLPSDKISCLFEDRDGNIWLGDNNGHLARYDSAKDHFILYEFLQTKHHSSPIRILQIAQDWKGDLLIATNGAGFIVFNYHTRTSQINLHKTENPETLLSNEIQSILVDKTNTVFVGTYGRGISKYSPFNQKFEVHTIPDDQQYAGDINAFTDCIEDSRGQLIAGTYYGFVVYDQKTWDFKHYLPGTSYEDNKILTLALAPDSTIWMSSIRSLYRYDKNYNKINSYVFDPALKDHSIYTIAFDQKNNLWIGLFRKGLLKIEESEWRNRNRKNLDYRIYFSDDDDSTSISGNQSWIVYPGNKNNLWIGSVGGLDKYNYDTDNFTPIFNPGTPKTLSFDSKGTMWIGTIGNGLFSYNLQTGENKRYTVEDGLTHSFIYGLIIDKNDNIWISTESGLSRFSIATETFRNYDIRDGLPDNHFDDKSDTRLSDGRIYMGTNKGFVLFNPENIQDDTSKTNVVLTSLKINNHKLDYFTYSVKDSLVNIPISQITQIQLNPNERDISFEFASLNYTAPHRVQYLYKLEGYDKEWIPASADMRTATYTNLDGGNYTFLVIATNGDRKWTEEPLNIKLKVIPPFYKTNEFILLLFIFALILVVLISRWRIKLEQKQKIKLATLVDERTAEINDKNSLLVKTADDLQNLNNLLEEHQQHIEEQSEELKAQRDELASSNATKDKLFSIIAHDLKNPFNVIMGYSDLLIEHYNKWDDTKKLHFLNMVKESTNSAYALLENLLQWSRSQNGTITFNPISVKASDIILQVLEQVADLTKKKDIKVEYNVPENDVLILVDLNMIRTVLRNLLTNAVKFSKKEGKIFIDVKKHNNTFVLFSIKDQGIGIEPENIKNLFQLSKTKTTFGTEGEKGTGLGLLLCRDFVETHRGEIWVESQPDNGTTFYFTVPAADQ
ncbi:MAG: hypothetical protein JXJ22_12955 [Bacteroidales bacterium]|nr:hypothetical protein [Bacteroidales bacterium]